MEAGVLQQQVRMMVGPTFTLGGRSALVTGACRGIGKAIAKHLAPAGARSVSLHPDNLRSEPPSGPRRC